MLASMVRGLRGTALVIYFKQLIRAAVKLGQELALQEGHERPGDMPSAEMAAQLGFKTKTKVHARHEYYKAEFCSSLWWPTSDGTVLGAKVGRQLYKHAWTDKPEKLRLGWLEAVAKCNAISWRFVPVLREIQYYYNDGFRRLNTRYAAQDQAHKDGERDKPAARHAAYNFTRAERDEDFFKFRSTVAHEATADTYHFFWKRYDLNPREV